ncbi:MAG: hypothetical protein EOO40_04615 [Deltaproteobacteria bacterium]|nr:MAG: hypothetical protein EOO40_04615 [Deltaproteobacteria bacterium]
MQLLRPEGSFADADWPIHNQTVRTLVEHLRSDPAVAEFWVQQLPAAVDLDAPLLATLTAEERLDYEAGLQGNLCDLLKAEHAAEHTAVLTAGELYLDARPSGEYAPMAAFLCSHAHTQRNNFAEAEQMAAHGVALAAQRPPQDNIVNLLRGIHINALVQQGYGASVRQTLYAYAEHNVQAPVSAGIDALYSAAFTFVINPPEFDGAQSNFAMCEALLQLNPSMHHHLLMMAAALRFLKGKRARLEGKILLDTFHLSPEERKLIAEMRTHALLIRGLKWLIPREIMLNVASAAANES